MDPLENTITTKNFDPESLETICRICLKDKKQIYSMHSSVPLPGLDFVSVSEIFEKLLFEDFETSMLICSECAKLVISAYTLKLNYDKATEILKNYYVNKQATEILTIKTEEYHDSSFTNEEMVWIDDVKPSLKKEFRVESKKKKKIKEVEIEFHTQILHLCPICPEEFTAEDLRIHAQKHQSLEKYLNIKNPVPETAQFYGKRKVGKLDISLHKCTHCGETVKDLRQHLSKHKPKQQYICDICSRTFKKINHLNVHKISHQKEFAYNCDICTKGFVSKKTYEFHMLKHTNEELPFECPDCSKRFYNPEHLNRHQLIHKENIKYSMKYKTCLCRICLVSFKDKESKDNHVCNPNTPKIKKFFCNTCNRGFRYNSELNNHIKSVHEIVKKLCQVCGDYVSCIYSHMRSHSKDKPHGCTQCEKQFHTKRQLQQHLFVHSGLKPFVCSVCAKAFNSLYNLKVHERIHKGDKCHLCSICGKGFLEKTYLKKHMRTH